MDLLTNCLVLFLSNFKFCPTKIGNLRYQSSIADYTVETNAIDSKYESKLLFDILL